jgi:RsiW-degrading membrane proteinase PrsW (M82 family)
MLDLASVVPAAIAPALLLLCLVVAADSRPEPPLVVWTAFGLGALSVFALELIRPWFLPLLAKTHNPWLALDEFALFMVGIPEESIKVLIIAAIALRARAFDEPMDGVVYGAAVGLGFATSENLGYLVKVQEWETLAIVRGILTVPFHAALGVIVGTYIASARFGGALGAHRGGTIVRARLFLLAWLVPVVLHTLYDIPLLALRRGLDSGDVLRACLQAGGLIVGFGTIAIAAWGAFRVAHHQVAWPRNSRTPTAAWRSNWTLLVVGAGIGFVGAVLLFSGIRQWGMETASHPLMFGVGSTLLLLAILIYADISPRLRRQTIEPKR